MPAESARDTGSVFTPGEALIVDNVVRDAVGTVFELEVDAGEVASEAAATVTTEVAGACGKAGERLVGEGKISASQTAADLADKLKAELQAKQFDAIRCNSQKIAMY